MAQRISNSAPEAHDGAYRVGRPRASDAVAAALCDAYGTAGAEDNYDDFPPDIAALLHRIDQQIPLR